jgi:hypothetical protein
MLFFPKDMSVSHEGLRRFLPVYLWVLANSENPEVNW